MPPPVAVLLTFTLNGTLTALPDAADRLTVRLTLVVDSPPLELATANATVGAASSSVIVKVAVLGEPREAPVAPLNVRFTVSLSSLRASFAIVMVNVLLAESASAQLRVPFVAE